MSGDIELDTSVAIRFLNEEVAITKKVLALPEIILPTVVVGELLFGAENSTRPLQNLPRYLEFISACAVKPLGRKTATTYARTRLGLKRKGRPIPMNDVWIAAQCLEHGWVLVTEERTQNSELRIQNKKRQSWYKKDVFQQVECKKCITQRVGALEYDVIVKSPRIYLWGCILSSEFWILNSS